MSISLEWYRVFDAVAREGSITRAAGVLFITQPAVSQCIRQLEQELGVALFARTSRGVRLTAEGRALHDYVSRGIDTIEQGERRIVQMNQLECGTVSIGASDTTLEFYLLSHLEDFHERYPGVRCCVTNVPTPDTLSLLRAGKIDFGAVTSPVEGQQGLRVVPVMPIDDVFVGGARFAHLRDREVSPDDLAQLPLICLEKNTSTRAYVDAFLATHGVFVTPALELSTSRLIAQFPPRVLETGRASCRERVLMLA